MGEISKIDRSPLLPDRHPQGDLFVCDIFDAVPKGDSASMEHPVFSLSTKPDLREREYSNGGAWLKVTPSTKGMATVHDRDILIYCISQLMAGKKQGRTPSKTLSLKAYDLLTATNRQTNGQAYNGLKSAFERLRGTTISTNVTTAGVEQFDVFGLIDKATVKRATRDGRMQDVEITLSDWLVNAVNGDEVLTLNRRYFQLRKPLERRLYDLARKHCGQQPSWQIGLEKLRLKTGSNSTPKKFKRLLGKIIQDDLGHDHMPDYNFKLEGGIITVTPKPEFTEAYAPSPAPQLSLFLKPETYVKAREAAPTWDIYVLEQEWRAWATEPPRNADAAFLGFCRSADGTRTKVERKIPRFICSHMLKYRMVTYGKYFPI